MSGYRSPWQILDIEATDDERAVKRAYSAKLKQIDVEGDPQAFIALRAAFDEARRIAIWKAEANVQQADSFDDEDDYEDDDTSLNGETEAAAVFHFGSDVAPVSKEVITSPKIMVVEQEDAFAHLPEVEEPLGLDDTPYKFDPSAPFTAFPDGGEYTSSRFSGLFWKNYAVPNSEKVDHYSVIAKTRAGRPDLAPDLWRIAEPAGVFAQGTHEGEANPLNLTTRPVSDIFPPETPVYVDFFRFAEKSQENTAERRAFAALEAGHVHMRRDDWGNADRERIAQLLAEQHFGPAEAVEVERLGQRLVSSPHLEELDYRDFLENWLAEIIAGSIPRSDGLLKISSHLFRWGTDAGQLYHSPAIDRCVERNRDIATVEKMLQPDNRWHKRFRLLQQPPPEKIAWRDQGKWREIQEFIDNIRAHRPTVEWELDRNHVAMWDALIDSKRRPAEPGRDQPFQWYHALIIGLFVLSLLGRCATAFGV